MNLTRSWIRTCEEKLLQAAIDLAIFTEHGINAKYIVDLAHLADDIEKNHVRDEKQLEVKQKQQRLRMGIAKICQVGQKIWKDRPDKYQNYIWQS